MNDTGTTTVSRDLWHVLLDIWNFRLFGFDHQTLTVQKIVVAGIIIAFSFIVAGILRKTIQGKLHKGNKISEQGIILIQRLVYYFSLLVGFVLALRIVHIPLTSFTFLGGALVFGLGFGAKELINNCISGFIIMAGKPIRIGDVVEVEGEIGSVADIGIRCTRILTATNEDIMFPNSVILQEKIINWTRKDNMILSKVSIGIAYESDIHNASELMIQAAKKCEGVLEKPAPFVLFKEHGASTLNFDVYFAVNVRNKMERWRYESDVNYHLNDTLRGAGIVIAFPQLDVHLDPSKSPARE